MSRRGTVVHATPATFAALEKAARRQNAKGVYIERGPHVKAAQIQTWLNGQEEDDLMFGEFASAQLLVAPPPCEDSDCDEDHGELATEGDVEAALDQLVSELPASFRTHVRDDAAALVRLSRRLSPATPWITLRIEILHEEACWRWHQDGYCGRTLVCYVGPGQRLGAEMNLNAAVAIFFVPRRHARRGRRPGRLGRLRGVHGRGGQRACRGGLCGDQPTSKVAWTFVNSTPSTRLSYGDVSRRWRKAPEI